MEPFDASRPSPSSLVDLITSRYPNTLVAEAMHAWFFSLNEQSWPNFATIVTTDEHDDASDLARPGAFRLNIGVGRATFERVAAAAGDATPDHTAADRILPHPVYAAQHWVAVVNPSADTLERAVLPLLDEAHERLAAQQARRRPTGSADADATGRDRGRGRSRVGASGAPGEIAGIAVLAGNRRGSPRIAVRVGIAVLAGIAVLVVLVVLAVPVGIAGHRRGSPCSPQGSPPDRRARGARRARRGSPCSPGSPGIAAGSPPDAPHASLSGPGAPSVSFHASDA